MPYCCQCGTQVGAFDNFCVKCGGKQPAAPSYQQSTGGSRPDGAANPYASGNPGNPYGSPPQSPGGAMAGISAKNASVLCYIPWFGWIACVIILATERFKRDKVEGPEVRFHAFQGLYLFVAWLIVDWVVSPMLALAGMGVGFGMGFGHRYPHPLGALLQLLILAAWIVMIIKVTQLEHYRLPIIGEMAERSVNEQKI